MWEENIGTLRGELEMLNKASLVSLAGACVCHAFSRNRDRLRQSVPHQQVTIAESVILNLLVGSSAEERLEELAARLRSLIPDDNADEFLGSQWAYMLGAIEHWMLVFVSSKPITPLMDAMYDAYQSVAVIVLDAATWTADRGLAGDDIDRVEKSAPECQSEIYFQMECIRKLGRGETVDAAL